LGKFFTAGKKEKAPKAPEPAPAPAPVAQEPKLAPGSAGQLKLHDVPPKTAAMLMAIVADKMGKPLNELRFISIKEVK
jgi:3-oxoacyl-ACP reductase-like protein